MEIKWNDGYSVGIERFDAQHQNFFNILARLIQDQENGGEEAVRRSIDGLSQYVTEHFYEEETLMRAHKYPGYEEHVLEHQKLMEKAQRLYADMDMGQPASVERVREVLENWILEHIGVVDLKYAPFFQGKGVR